MGDVCYRLSIMLLNVFFPPLAVAIMCGLEATCALNCALYLCAIIPGHVHGFYVSCVYFHRRRKVRKGRYPGGAKALIYSRHVLNGGANQWVVDRLYWAERAGTRTVSSRRRSISRSKHRFGGVGHER